METTQIPFPEEIGHLQDTLKALHKSLDGARQMVKKHDRDYLDSKRYMAEYRHEIDPREIFQNELLLGDIERSGSIAVDKQERLKKLLDAPYFARIDFLTDEQDIFYIGRFTFSNGPKILIYDWRSPAASMFYNCELGAAGYDAPIGRIEGELTRKRQFKISNGEMRYAFESSVNIQDDILQRELSTASDEKMKTIITTLQKEQNTIIRDETSDVLLIQGAAGSGKTSIALHRIAYLLYRFKDTLTAQNIIILSPNRVFGDYISGVLPELGEEPIYEMSFADAAEIQLEGIIEFEPAKNPLETEDQLWKLRARFKSTLDFLEQIKSYLEQMDEQIFQPEDLIIEQFQVSAEWIHKRFKAYQRFPVQRRLQETARDICDKLITENIRADELPKERHILARLKKMLKKKSTLELYRAFYQAAGQPELIKLTGKKLEWEDVYPFMYFHHYYNGLKINQRIKHLVIDEMQDYTPVQYAVMNLLFNCQKTILGDFNQSLHPFYQNSLADLHKVYEGEQLVEMNKSYRSSYEIINFAKKILRDSKVQPIERHGEEPEVITCDNYEEELMIIDKRIESFKYKAEGTIGILFKTMKQAEEAYEKWQEMEHVSLITPDSEAFAGKVMITSIQMSKGLEFDEVIIPCAGDRYYREEYDRKLLYVACTRAMHRLVLTCSGVLSPLLP